MSPDPFLVITCEHGGHRVPEEFDHLFAGAGEVLASHRGWDPGALALAEYLAAGLAAPLFAADVTRLLVDLNRSPGNRTLFSAYTRSLPPAAKAQLLARFYHPWRRRVARAVAEGRRRGRPVLHLASHSFTPVMDGKVRRADLGLLYDPGRRLERRFCLEWQARLARGLPERIIRRNSPYRGVSDGLTRQLRREFGEGYLGIEIEVNQRFWLENRAAWERLAAEIARSLKACLETCAA